MSELINNNDSRATIRWELLTSASALVLIAAVSPATLAKADDADHPLVWITVGVDAMQLTGQGQIFTPPWLTTYSDSPAFKPVSLPKTEAFQALAYDASFGFTFQPENSDWHFAASVQFGRTGRQRNTSEVGPPDHFKAVESFGYYFTGCVTPYSCAGIKHTFTTHPYTAHTADYSVVRSRETEAHMILDFEVGKDVGIGLFFKNNTAHLNLGVRVAQFGSRSSTDIHARPDIQHYQSEAAFLKSWFPNTYVPWHPRRFHVFADEGSATRSFHGVGPKISWDDSLPIAGTTNANLTVDWGVNVAVLFGKQKVKAEQQIYGRYRTDGFRGNSQYQYTHSTPIARRKAVIVPNAGGFAGLSFNYASAKISLGYRGDFFFGAMDTGWDKRKSENVGFYGPFATISVGLGG